MEEENLPKFGEMTYWESGYRDGSAPAEWFLPFETIKPFLMKHLPAGSNLLVIGCGTSSLSGDLSDEGFKVRSMDYSEAAIEEMKQKRPDLGWDVMDVRHMSYADGSYDAVVDKGTLDCLFFLDETNESVLDMLKDVYRVIAPGGRYIVVTCGHPMQRVEVFTSNPELKWSVVDWEEYEPPDGSFTHPSAYIYCLKKNVED